ncbi:MAG: tRNA epoxyqueuosine(34) reductase QueG [Ignavibacteriaceae bacterium]|nr:tRNA epoxyqueuosine(34) reductase QueG [Ignavibacteriaceae bacterium]
MKISNQQVVEIAKKYQFDLIGFAEAENLHFETEKLNEWIQSGFHAGMGYMIRNLEKRKDVKILLPSAKSVVSLGMNYYTSSNHSHEIGIGKVSRYAWGKDYHLIIWERLKKIINELKTIEPAFEAVSYVDTGPVMDKAWAVKAGIGWQGNHTNIINKLNGSWFFIANIITNWEFEYQHPIKDFCGSCTACIDACPTDAIVEEYVLDSNKCISYLTIENKKEIPAEFKNKFENWIFGCDICQEVCPWNKKFSKVTNQSEFNPNEGNNELNLNDLLNMTQEEFDQKFCESPIKRAKLSGMKRNAEFLLET